MHSAVPAPAARLLDFIGKTEVGDRPDAYDTVYGHKQGGMAKKISQMTLDEVIADGPRRTKYYGSSACGRYQFMTATLKGIKAELKLTGREVFTPDFQDDLGWYLLRRRGYDKWIKGEMSTEDFMLRLAQEWASFPIPYAANGNYAGQSYYAGDGMNKALITLGAVRGALAQAWAARTLPQPTTVVVAKDTTQPAVVKDSPPPAAMSLGQQLWAWILNGFRRVA